MTQLSPQTDAAAAGDRECHAMWLSRDLEMGVGSHVVAAPGPGEVRVAVRWAGVCESDLRVLRTGERTGAWPAVLGREVYGEIDAVGAGVRLAVGTPVILDSRLPCLDCDDCRTDPNRCPHVGTLGEARPGGFASFCTVPSWLAHPVPEDLDGSVAVLAHPLAVALHALAHVSTPPRRTAVIGHGPIGALIHLELRAAGCPVDVAELAPLRAALAEGFQAVVVECAALLTESGYDLVVHCGGPSGSLGDAVRVAACGATILVLSDDERPTGVVPAQIADKRLRLVGVSAFVDELPEAIARLAAQPRRYRSVVTDTVGLEALPARMGRLAEASDAVKLLVRP